jgi:hypothetical protein
MDTSTGQTTFVAVTDNVHGITKTSMRDLGTTALAARSVEARQQIRGTYSGSFISPCVKVQEPSEVTF